jgi:hypothetical protein
MTTSNLGLESDVAADAGRAPSLRRAQWERYARYHQSRSNLLLHILFVPLFLAGNVTFLIALVERRWLVALGGLMLAVFSLMAQGRGHRQEPLAPEPFTGPRNAMARILLEQWVTFPRFVLSGAWARGLRGSRSV